VHPGILPHLIEHRRSDPIQPMHCEGTTSPAAWFVSFVIPKVLGGDLVRYFKVIKNQNDGL